MHCTGELMTIDRESVIRVPDAELEYDADYVYRIAGAPFTGIAYDDAPGRGRSEVSFRDGLQEGPARHWYPSGQLRAESNIKDNVLHGRVMELTEDGRLVFDARYEHGIVMSSVRRDAAGRVVERFEIDPEGPNYAWLQQLRRE